MRLESYEDIRDCREIGRHSTAERGLYLEVREGRDRTVTRSWIFRWKRAGRTAYKGLGAFPEISWTEARDRAAEQRSELRRAESGDVLPAPIAPGARAVAGAYADKPLFPAVVLEYMARKAGVWRENSPNQKTWNRQLEMYAYPFIGSKRCHEITKADVVAILMQPLVGTNRGRDVDGTPLWQALKDTGRQIMGKLDAVLLHASSVEYMPKTSVTVAAYEGNLEGQLPEFVVERSHHPAVPWHEGPEIYRQTVDFKPAPSTKGEIQSPSFRLACLLIALTSVRKSTMARARWREIDWDERMWKIPATNMKGRRGKVMPHSVPLSKPALKILRELTGGKQPKPDAFVIAQADGRPLYGSCLDNIIKTMRSSSGAYHSIHGWRSVFKDWARSNNMPEFMSEFALAHKVGKEVIQAYGRDRFDRERRTWMEQYATFLSATNVVALPKRKAA